MSKNLLLIPVLFAISFAVGYSARSCPAPVPAEPCEPVVQVTPAQVETQIAAPALEAQQKAADKTAALQATIDDLRHQAAAKPRVVTVTKTVPAECKQYVPTAPAECIDPDDLELLRKAQAATNK